MNPEDKYWVVTGDEEYLWASYQYLKEAIKEAKIKFGKVFDNYKKEYKGDFTQ